MVPFSLPWKIPLPLWLIVILLYFTGNGRSTDQYELRKFDNFTYQQTLNPFVVNDLDSREYLGLKLANQLEVLLISDTKVDQAYVAMNVEVGTKDDSNYLSGMALLVEKLVVKWRDNFPNDNDQFQYIESWKGETRVRIEYDRTCYYFGIEKNELEVGLDRISQLFIAPDFNQSSVEREARRSDPEIQKFQNDFRSGLERVKKNVSNPKHPYSNLGLVNYETLTTISKSQGIVIRDILIDFYKRNYLAQRMKLMVFGKESIDELKKMVIPMFSKIPNYHPESSTITGTPFTKEYLGIQINVISSTKLILELDFILPPQKSYYKEKPTSYLSYFLNHEGTGSLISHLMELDWIQSSYAGLSEDNSEFAVYNLNFNLSPLGLKHTKEIMEKVFSYLSLIRNSGINQDRFNEIQFIKNQDFQYYEEESSSYNAETLASAMQSSVPLTQVIMNRDGITRYNATLINETLNYFEPRNMRLTVVSPLVPNKRELIKEPYYGLEYNYEKIDESLLKELLTIKSDDSLQLPEPNPYVPVNFLLVNSTSHSKFPDLIYDNPGNLLWHTFGNDQLPKVTLNLLIKNNLWFNSSEKNSKLDFLIKVINENLEPVNYLASKAGFSYSIISEYPGISIELCGFNDKASELIMKIIKQIHQPNITNEMLEEFNHQLSWSQEGTISPYPINMAQSQIEDTLMESITINPKPTITELTLDDLNQFINQDLSHGNLEMLVMGNFHQSQSKSLFDCIQSELNLNPVPREFEIPRRSIELPVGHHYLHQILYPDQNEIESAVTVYFDLYSYNDPKQHILTKFVCQLLAEPPTDQLQTKKPLNDIIQVEVKEFGSRGGILISIQDENDPIKLESRINLFLDQFANEIINISDKNFNLQKTSLKTIIAGDEEEYKYDVELYWSSIKSGHYNFQRDITLQSQLSKLTKSDLIEFISTLSSKNSMRRKLSIHVVSPKLKRDPKLILSDYGEVINDLKVWKGRQKMAIISEPL